MNLVGAGGGQGHSGAPSCLAPALPANDRDVVTLDVGSSGHACYACENVMLGAGCRRGCRCRDCCSRPRRCSGGDGPVAVGGRRVQSGGCHLKLQSEVCGTSTGLTDRVSERV